jgi:diguanylate cyclase (GGDEF)-like protein
MGMEAMSSKGEVSWDSNYVYASIVLGPAFGVLSANRLIRPTTRLCWCAGGASFLMAIITTHFTSIAGLHIEMGRGSAPPDELLVDDGLMMLIFAVMGLLMTAGLSTYVIDRNTRRDAGAQVRHVALHDPLTGLPNRAFLRSTLEDLLAESRARFGGVAVVGVDLDRFKPVNDVHGHAAGDAMLVSLAARVRDVLEPGEEFCRTGGDEFVALRGGVLNDAEARRFAERLREAMLKSMDWKGGRLSVGASLGVCLHPRDGADAETLLNRVDLALYRAKEAPGDAIQFYDARMDEASRSRSAMAMELRQALDRTEFVLYMQPQNEMATRRCVGFEALIRWRHSIRGLAPPNDFIPVAEKTGLIREIGAWALREACRMASSWPERCKVAVNVAPMQLAQPGFVEMVLDALLESGLSAERLDLEVTEASLIADQACTIDVMNNLKRAGIRIAMDDYGTGYASSATLKAFPFDKI